ncbi:MAG: ribonuclease HII [Candidatus Omnitrophica bacterium]|nr:ribonuclease HII [Candidatus Omnitrophota bacterium]
MTKRLTRPVPKRMLRYESRARKQGYRHIAGIDEAGRGPLAGPVVAASVIIKDWSFKATLNDSKLLTSSQRERAYEEILRKAVVGVGIVGEKVIDEINIYRATGRAMDEALTGLPEAPDMVLIDGRVPLRWPHAKMFIIKGDRKSASIAAASIIAKVTRDRIMQDYDRSYPEYGFKRHKGYGTRAHAEALTRYGPCPIHRRTFRPVRELIVPGLEGVDTKALIPYNHTILA